MLGLVDSGWQHFANIFAGQQLTRHHIFMSLQTCVSLSVMNPFNGWHLQPSHEVLKIHPIGTQSCQLWIPSLHTVVGSIQISSGWVVYFHATVIILPCRSTSLHVEPVDSSIQVVGSVEMLPPRVHNRSSARGKKSIWCSLPLQELATQPWFQSWLITYKYT